MLVIESSCGAPWFSSARWAPPVASGAVKCSAVKVQNAFQELQTVTNGPR